MMKRQWVVAACSLVLSVEASVFDDADALWFGARDFNGDGVFQTGEMVDVRHASDTERPSNKAARVGGALAVPTLEDVEIGTAGVVARSAPCLQLNGNITTNVVGTATNYTSKACFVATKKLIDKDTWTVLMRFRPFFMEHCANQLVTLVNNGNRWNKNSFYIEIQVNKTGTGGYVRLRSGGDSSPGLWCTQLVVTNNVWHELAVTVGDSKVRVGLRQPKLASADGVLGRWRWQQQTFSLPSDYSFSPYSDFFRLGGDANNSSETAIPFACLRASVHMTGLWSRVLSDREVFEAFGVKLPSLLSVGCSTDKAGSEIFLGGGDADVTTNDCPWNWYLLPSFLAPGRAVSVSFDVPTRLAGLSQALRVKAASDSGTGRLTVALDGTNVATIGVLSGMTASRWLDGRFFTVGSHVLTLRRTDGGVVPVRLDGWCVNGSWQLGEADGSFGEFAPEAQALAEFPVTDGVVAELSRSVTSAAAGGMRIRLLFDADPNDMSSCRYETAIAANGVSPGGGRAWGWRLNDETSVHVFPDAEDGKSYSIRLPLSGLCKGQNVLEIVSLQDSGTPAWIDFDYHRLVSSGKNGLMLLLR